MSGEGADPPRGAGEVGDELRRLVQRSFRGNVDFLQRASELTRTAARDARQEQLSADEVVKRLVRFNLDYYSLLTDYAQAFMGDVLALTERSLGGASSGSSGGSAGATIRAEGPPGSRVRTAFIVENRSNAAVTLGLSATDFRAGNRTVASAGLLHFDPPAPEVPPRGEATVVVVVELAKELEPGIEYRSTIRVAGTPDQELELIARAVEAEVEITPQPSKTVSTEPAPQPAAVSVKATRRGGGESKPGGGARSTGERGSATAGTARGTAAAPAAAAPRKGTQRRAKPAGGEGGGG